MCGPRQITTKRPHQSVNFRIAALDAGNMKRQLNEITETVVHRRIDLCCLQETRRTGDVTRKIIRKDCI